jgi:3-oxoacyl-[acyl-carrier protein] reductase
MKGRENMKKTAIVTGASGDIGKEIARFLLEKNYTVVGIYFNNNEALDELIDIYGDNLHTLKCDLSSFSVARKFQTILVKIILM